MERRGITFTVVRAKMHLLNLIMLTNLRRRLHEGQFQNNWPLFIKKHPGHGSKRKTEKLFQTAGDAIDM